MTGATGELTMKSLRPFWSLLPGRVTVIASSATEEQRESGLVVPITHDGDDGAKRGVVLDVTEEGTPIEAGSVIFYRRGIKIGDVVVVDLVDVLAYEAD